MPDPIIPPEVVEDNLSNEIDKFYQNYKGAEDLRTPEEKAKEISQEELVAAIAPIDWKEKKKSEFRSFPELNQLFTYACVAFTTAKLAIINFWLKTKEIILFSADFIYDNRINKPQQGMIGDNAFQIWEEKGIPLNAVCPSKRIQENDPIEISFFAKEVAKGFKLGKSVSIPNGAFDQVVSTIQVTGKGVMTWFYFTEREWAREVPKIMDNLTGPNDPLSLRHSVSSVDFGIATDVLNLNGEQVLKIEDSAHFGGKSVRYITREFFQLRNFFNKYPMNFNYEDPPADPIPEKPKPKYTFNNNLSYGMRNNAEVAKLQDILKYEGLYPVNVVSTGNYLTVTADAVLKFQEKYGITPTSANDVGPLTRAKLNQLYSQ